MTDYFGFFDNAQNLQKRDDTVENAKTEEEKLRRLQHYRIDPVWGIFITNFSLEHEERMMRDVWLTDTLDNHRPFTDKMRMIFLELPALKRAEECDTALKEWLYIIKNSKNMEQIPFVNDKPIYKQLAEKARYAALTPEEQELYELDRRNEMAYWDSMFLSKAEGRAEERAKALEEKKVIAQNLKNNGVPVEVIASSTGFPIEEINNL